MTITETMSIERRSNEAGPPMGQTSTTDCPRPPARKTQAATRCAPLQRCDRRGAVRELRRVPVTTSGLPAARWSAVELSHQSVSERFGIDRGSEDKD